MNSMWEGMYVEAFLLENVHSLVGCAFEQEDLDFVLEWEDDQSETHNLCWQTQHGALLRWGCSYLGVQHGLLWGREAHLRACSRVRVGGQGRAVSSIANIPSLDMCVCSPLQLIDLSVVMCVKSQKANKNGWRKERGGRPVIVTVTSLPKGDK